MTEPLRDANLIGNGPEVLRRIDAVADDFDMTPGTCGKDGQSVPVGCGQATLRITGVTLGGTAVVSELLDLATSVVGPGPARRGAGGLRRPGHRHRGAGLRRRGRVAVLRRFLGGRDPGRPRRGRGREPLGFAWAGSLDPDVIAPTLADARDNARYATPDPDVGLARPDGAPAAELDLWDDGVATTPMEDKVALALELERATRSAIPGCARSRRPTTPTAGWSWPWPPRPASRRAARRTTPSSRWTPSPGRGPTPRPAPGSAWAGVPATSIPTRPRTTPCGGPPGCSGPRRPDRAVAPWSSIRRVVSTLLSVLASALSGEAVVKGRSFFAGRIGEMVADPAVTLVDDPTDRRAFTASTYDAEGLACRRNVLIADGVLRMFVYDTVSARRASTASTGSAVRGGFAGTPTAGCRALVLQPGTKDADEILAAVGDGLYVQSVTGIHSGVNPVSGDFSVGAEGLMIRGGALAEPVREVTVASTLQRMLQSVVEIGSDLRWLPGVAAGQTLAIADMQLSGE